MALSVADNNGNDDGFHHQVAELVNVRADCAQKRWLPVEVVFVTATKKKLGQAEKDKKNSSNEVNN